MKLNNTAIKSLLKKPGRHGDGDGLFLRVMKGGVAFWSYRYRVSGKEREMSLGRYTPRFSLAEARKKHAGPRNRVLNDKADPAREVQPGQGAPTFGEAADAYLAAHERSWRNDKHRWQWRQTLTDYCAPIRDMPVDAVDTAAVHRVLKPLWASVPETASRLRGRIEAVLDAAQALGHIDENRANPARWRGHLDKLLPKRQRLTRGHHAAMPYADVPTFLSKLKATPGSAAKALQFVILTAARSGEAFGMRWDEINLDAKVWTAPAERMKAQREHQVPLSHAAIEILQDQMKARKHPYVFPGKSAHEPLSNMAMAMTMRRLGAGEYTVHGFRSAFRDWCAESGVDDSVAEQCLAHKIGDAVTRAYLRTTVLERRRQVMQGWADYLAGESAVATVVPFKGQRR
jgi:integrase